MKIGEIKIAALKLMFVNYGHDLQVSELATMSDENYSGYLVNMPEAINRALDRIQNACVVPVKTRVIEKHELTVGKHRDSFDLSAIGDLFVIDRVVAEDEVRGYDGNAEYQQEGDLLILEKGSDYRILYFPILKPVDETVGDNDEMSLPQNIARMIPLFVKGDLFQEEEPDLAADARNQFEALLQDLKRTTPSRQTRIERVI